MNLKFNVAVCAVLGLMLAGCGGGDIDIDASNNSTVTDNSVTNGGGGANNPCANYTDPDTNTVKEGSFDGTNCSYDSSFVGENNPLAVDLTIPFITGVHIFEDTLQVGANVDGTDPNIIPPAGGAGPTLTVEAGNTLAWTQSSDYLLVNRGSQIIANGSPAAPITFTGFSDAVTGTAGPFDVQLWGGVVINGNGITSKCDDTQRANNTCHILSEGKPSNYGGNDNGDNSGTLQYVVIKHPGFEVAPGDELNGLTLNAVGSGTTIENVQIYSTFDDGVEFFGGAVEVSNMVLQYVRDDSIDYADGWVGSISNALVIHSADDGNRCIEGDNQGSAFDALPRTAPVVSNMTCIISANDAGTHGDSEGPLLRRGVQSQILDSIIYDGYARTILANGGNECLELDEDETRQLAQDGSSSIASTVIACEEATKDSLPNGDTVEQWVLDTGAGSYPSNTNNVILTASDDVDVQILDGFYSVPFLTDADADGDVDDLTGSSFVDDAGVAFDVTSTTGDRLVGAVSEDDDWTSGWTVCLVPQAQDPCGLWFLP